MYVTMWGLERRMMNRGDFSDRNGIVLILSSAGLSPSFCLTFAVSLLVDVDDSQDTRSTCRTFKGNDTARTIKFHLSNIERQSKEALENHCTLFNPGENNRSRSRRGTYKRQNQYPEPHGGGLHIG